MFYEKFDEGFDEYNGGALYVGESDDGVYRVAGVLWLDGGQDELHYFAFVAEYEEGDEVDGLLVTDIYSSADAFNGAVDSDIYEEIGWFDTMDEAVAAVEDYVAREG